MMDLNANIRSSLEQQAFARGYEIGVQAGEQLERDHRAMRRLGLVSAIIVAALLGFALAFALGAWQ